MKITHLLTLLVLSCSLMSCNEEYNPLLDKNFETVDNLPPFDQIKPRHFTPAIEAAMTERTREIHLITSNRNEPTFQNTIIPFDRSGQWLSSLTSILFNIVETDVSDTLNIVVENLLPRLTAQDDDIYTNDALFARIRHVYDNRATLDSTQRRVAELYYQDFVRRGALLSAADKKTLKDINQRLSLLSHTFGQNALAAVNDYRLVVDTLTDLAGLPENVIAAAAQKASEANLDGKWIFTLSPSSIMPFLQYADNANLRSQIYNAYISRGTQDGSADNRKVVKNILSLRAKRAALLGYKTHAHYATEVKMSGSPEAVDTFLNVVWPYALTKAKAELVDLQKIARRTDRNATVGAADWAYWTEKLRAERYNIDQARLAEYFPLNSVRHGMFSVASRLYGLQFSRLSNAPLYNVADSEVWQVADSDKSPLGIVYFDWHPRSTKGAGAWTTSFRPALDNFDGTRQTAQVSIVCNFTPPTADTPALLTFEEVQTMFHEFGHALQSLFARGAYLRTNGDLPHDYVELPSQINELWAAEPEVLKSFAKHYRTGETIPDEMIEKLIASATFNQGFASTEYLAASLLDLKLHSLSAADNIDDVIALEQKIMSQIGLIPEIAPRYRTTYFGHIFDGGYSAGYYDYEWAQMFVADAFAAFKDSADVFCPSLARSFRTHCLADAGDKDPLSEYIAFRGRRPDIKYLLDFRGFTTPESKNKKK